MRIGLVLVVLLVNLAALLSLYRARVRGRGRVRWTAAIVLLPPIGALLWLLRGRHRAGAGPMQRATTDGTWQT